MDMQIVFGKKDHVKDDPNEEHLIYTNTNEEFINEKDDIKLWLNEIGWHEDEHLGKGISLEDALKTIDEENLKRETDVGSNFSCYSNPHSLRSTIPYRLDCRLLDEETNEYTVSDTCNTTENATECPGECVPYNIEPKPPKGGCYYLQSNKPNSMNVYKTWDCFII